MNTVVPEEFGDSVSEFPEAGVFRRDEQEVLSRRPLGSSGAPVNSEVLQEFRRQLEESGYADL